MTLVRGRVEPRRDVTAGHEQGVAVSDREGVPDAEDQVGLEEQAI